MLPVDLSEALNRTNNYGRYQIILFVLCAFLTAQELFHMCLDMFVARPLPWRYVTEESFMAKITDPPCNVSASQWQYAVNDSVSIMRDFSLHCSPIKLRIITVVFFLGRFAGFILFWNVTCTFGRRWPLVIALWVNSIVTWITSCATSYEVYVILRAVDGFTLEGYIIGAYVIMVECINERHRRPFSSQFRSLQGVGFVILSATAYLSKLWKVMWLIAGIIITLHALLASAFLPESPTWLLAKGRRGDVINFIYKVSRFNGTSLKDKFYIVEPKRAKPHQPVTTEPELFLTTVAVLGVWLLLHVAEYTLYFNVVSLPGNDYLNLVLLGLCDIPGRLLPLVLIEKIGRKRSLLLLNLITSATLFACCYDNKITRNTFFMISKFFLAGNLVTVQIYTHELTPRSSNAEMTKICLGGVRLVGCGVPFLTLLNSLSTMYLYVVMGGCVLVSSFLLLPLPEVTEKRLETVSDFIELFYATKLKVSRKKKERRRTMEHPTVDKLPRAVTMAMAGQSFQLPSSSSSRKKTLSNPRQMNPNVRVLYGNGKSHSLNSNGSIDISAISNTDCGNLSMNDPDIRKLPYHTYRANIPAPATSTPVYRSGGKAPIGQSLRPESLALEQQIRPLLRNPSYESSLDTPSLIKSESIEDDAYTLRQNTMSDIPSKSSVRKQYFSLSRV